MKIFENLFKRKNKFDHNSIIVVTGFAAIRYVNDDENA